MIRQSISLTAPNDNWLNALVDSEEYASKSEVVNDLIRKARAQHDVDKLRMKLIEAEQSGFVKQTLDEMKQEFKSELRSNGGL
jgi:antitoxin ParD1/3/4